MAVGFVMGRGGVGKTWHCVRAIKEGLRESPLMGPAIIFLAPRQATFSTERDFACDPELNGYFRLRVVSFEQLGREVLAECGGAEIPPEITPRGRQMLLGHLLQRHRSELRYFQAAAEHRSLALKLDTTFAEFERAGQNVGELEGVLENLQERSDPARRDKLHDLALIYRAYTSFLGQDWLDQNLRLKHVLERIDSSKLFDGATVYCDGFFEFTDYERRLLAAMGKRCANVTITLPMDPSSVVLEDHNLFPSEESLFHKSEMAYRKLRILLKDEGVAVEDPVALRGKPMRFKAAGLREVERKFGEFPIEASALSDGVEMVEAADKADEVQAAAREILKLRGRGVRFRDMAVLVRWLPDYLEPVSVYFREHRIPFFADYRRPSDYHPLLQFVRALLAIANGNWPHDALMQLVKTDLAGLSTTQADQLENYVLKHRIRGERWASEEAWEYEDTAEVEILRRGLLGKLLPWVKGSRGKATVAEQVRGLFAVLEQFGIRQKLLEWMGTAERENKIEELGEHQQVWAELVKLFDEMVDLLGGELVSLLEFREILEAGLESFDLGLTPPTVDQVLLGQVDRTRTSPGLKAVLVLGLNERSFPRTPVEDSVLSDSEIRFFEESKVEVGRPSERLMLDENFWAYSAMTSALDYLWVSRFRSDSGGKVVGASRYWNYLGGLFPGVLVSRVGSESEVGLISTPRELVMGLARWVRENPEERTLTLALPLGTGRGEEEAGKGALPWGRLYQWMVESGVGRRGWRGLSYENRAALSAEVARKVFSLPLYTTAGALESFASCPFQHFARFGLQLLPRETGEISALDFGSAYHEVLGRIVRSLMKHSMTWRDLTDAQRETLVANAAKDVGEQVRGEVFLSTARNRYLLSHIEQTLNRVVQAQTAVAARGKFRPGFAGAKFGAGGKMPAVTLPIEGGGEVKISGSIDRIDLHEDLDLCNVIDYRLGAKTLSLTEAYYGLALHLVVCLLAVETHGEALSGRKLSAGAAFYMRMVRGLGDVEHPELALDPETEDFHLAVKPRGLMEEGALRALDEGLAAGGASKAFNARINKDGSIGNRDKSDVVNRAELAGLLHHVRRWIGRTAERIVSGDIAVKPYLMGSESPCPRCEYRSVCRFEVSQGYRMLPKMDRATVLANVAEEVHLDEGGK